MSTSAPQPGSPSTAPSAPYPRPSQDSQKREIRVVSHCSLFYWWPVWAVGFIMFLITAITGEHMVTVPVHTVAVRSAFDDENGKSRDAYVLPIPDPKSEKKTFLPLENEDKNEPKAKPKQPYMWMSTNKNLGV